MAAITLTTFNGATPVRETLPQTNLADAVEATMARAREAYEYVKVMSMGPDSADIWASRSETNPEFGEGYFLEVK